MSNRTVLITKLSNLPFTMIMCLILLSFYSCLILYAAAGGDMEPWAYRQLINFWFFLFVAIIISVLELRTIFQLANIIYLISLIMIILVEVTGKSAMGATRWLNLGLITIQPSEILKISIVISLARYFHVREQIKDRNDLNLFKPLILVLIPIALVIKQPDLGTGIVLLILVTVIFYLSGVKLIYFILSALSVIIMAPILWYSLHNYQKKRILTFLDPEQDPLGAGYNIIQSKIAIGSGGLFGKGLLSGTQGQLSFLPEYQTDFIFAFLMEELGFTGGVLLIFLYAIIIINSLSISINSKSTFARLVSSGIVTIFFSHIFINIAMVMGILPVVGVPLPLISYGRTMLGSILIGFGLIMNCSINRSLSLK